MMTPFYFFERPKNLCKTKGEMVPKKWFCRISNAFWQSASKSEEGQMTVPVVSLEVVSRTRHSRNCHDYDYRRSYAVAVPPGLHLSHDRNQ